jgi:hypothetical protein
MPQIEITAVGALVRPEGDEQYRPKTRGDRLNVTDEVAGRLIANGTAKLVDQTVADDAEEAQPMGGQAIDLESMTVPELRQFADERRIRLTGASRRPEIIGMIEAALDNPEAGDAIRAAAVNPTIAAESPLANPEAAEPGGPASPHPAPQGGDDG